MGSNIIGFIIKYTVPLSNSVIRFMSYVCCFFVLCKFTINILFIQIVSLHFQKKKITNKKLREVTKFTKGYNICLPFQNLSP